jgi:prophage regulatory protein
MSAEQAEALERKRAAQRSLKEAFAHKRVVSAESGKISAKVHLDVQCERVLREPEVARLTGRSREQRWRDERAGLFPKRIRLGPNAVGWLESEVSAWLAERIAERDARGAA